MSLIFSDITRFFLGQYSIECLGLYCGDCPLAIFISFAGQINCVMTLSRSIAQKDKISLQLRKWFTLPGLQDVHVSRICLVSLIQVKLN